MLSNISKTNIAAQLINYVNATLAAAASKMSIKWKSTKT